MAVMDVTRDELIELYLGNSVSGQAWINTLDRLQKTSKSQLDQFKKLITSKNCSHLEGIIGNVPGTSVETEIVIGGAAGRDFLFNRKKKVFLNCDFGNE